MIDDELNVEPAADRFLRELRFGRDRAESTTKAYAGGIALFFRWCVRTGRDWTTAAADMGLFMIWLKYTPVDGGQVVPGPGSKPVRGDGRINRVLVAVRGFLSFAVVSKEAPQWVLGAIYELADTRDLPLEAQSEDGGLVLPDARPAPPPGARDRSGPGQRRGNHRPVRGLPVGSGPADRSAAVSRRAPPQ